MIFHRKPEPRDFPPKSPHDLEWGGYDHDAYEAALKSWEDYIKNSASIEEQQEAKKRDEEEWQRIRDSINYNHP